MRIRLKIAQFADGERFPMLLDESGVPLLHPTLFALTQLRARNLAANSISNSLRAIGLFYSFLETRQIDLEARLAKCQLLSLGEIEALVEGFRVRRAIEEVTMTSTPSSGPQRVFMERHRRDLKPGSDELVSRGWHATRLLYTRIYIEWLVAGRLFMPQTSESARRELRSTLDFFVKAINSRMPSASDSQNPKQGLAEEEIEAVMDAIRPDSPRNPWKDPHARIRNHAMITLFKELGARRGEIAGLEVSDINFRTGSITIHRKPDNPRDPRRNQPNTKTLARKLELDPQTLDLLEAYVLRYRSSLPFSRNHKFLFVASGTGRPLSLPAINKVFRVLRIGCPEVHPGLSPHSLRHTWNDSFSRLMDEKKVPPEREEKFRSYLMGWQEGSGTSRKYTKRHVQREAQRASLELQKRLAPPPKPS